MPAAPTPLEDLQRRIARLDWAKLEAELDETGCTRLPQLLEPEQCNDLVQLYDQPARFRNTIEMSRHAFGEGSYRYFAYPLPEIVAALRSLLYPPLRSLANRWHEQLRIDGRYPASLSDFLEGCHAAGQKRPTPLLLRYGPDGYNRMHQDVYGEIAFPLQLACLLSTPQEQTAGSASPRTGFGGGEFLISEQRARMQTRVEAIRLEIGDAVLFANAVRPVRSTRGYARAQMRHGLSRVRSGERFALGIIFHDAS